MAGPNIEHVHRDVLRDIGFNKQQTQVKPTAVSSSYVDVPSSRRNYAMRVPSGFNEIRNELSGLADGTKFDESHSVGEDFDDEATSDTEMADVDEWDGHTLEQGSLIDEDENDEVFLLSDDEDDFPDEEEADDQDVPPPRHFVRQHRTLPVRGIGRPRYGNDDHHPEYLAIDPVESDDESGPGKDAVGETEDTMDYAHRFYDMRMNYHRRFGLGKTLPLLAFTRKLETVGYGEVSLPGPLEGDLDDFIHPVFQQANWIREPFFGEGNINENNLLWQRLKPALRLATKFITDPNMLGWWIRALAGRQTKDETTEKTYISDPGDMGAEGANKIAVRLVKLVNRVRWSFCLIKQPQPGHQTHGMLARNFDTLLNYDRTAKHRPQIPHVEPDRAFHIAISDFFRAFLLGPGYDPVKAPCRVMRVHWFLAITMTHELAHAFYQSKAAVPTFKEPYFDLHDIHKEMGWSWEKSLFGLGELQSLVDPVYGILSLQWGPMLRSAEKSHVVCDTKFRYPVDPLYIHKFFLKSTWQRLQAASAADKTTFWNIPLGEVAVTEAPKRRGDLSTEWIWVSEKFPDEHRLSMHYWRLKNMDWMKKQVFKAKMDRAKEKNLKQDWAYPYHKRRPRKMQKAERVCFMG